MPAGGWRLRLEHHTLFQYDGSVRSSYNEARLTPMTTATQTTLESTVQVRPGSISSRYIDYWGTTVTVFEVHEPHDACDVVGRSVVETSPAGTDRATASWDDLARDDVRDRFAEVLAPTARTAIDDELRVTAARLSTALTPHRTALAVADWVGEAMAYVPGSTGVHASALEAYQQRSGVCQDLAHLTIGMLRSLGIPARYVSGYLHPVADAPLDQPAEGQSHAWVEWWAGQWVAHDPTNGAPGDERHVLVARGRDYGDVPPVKGIYTGAPSSGLEVSVTVTRVA